MRKILYIEDTENNRILIRRRLEPEGYTVMTAEDSEQGLAMAVQEMPDLILMDLSLPGMDGWEATQRLKENPKTKHIPVIALTAHVMPGDRERSMQAGCDEYDTKPFQFARLLAKMDALLSLSRSTSPL